MADNPEHLAVTAFDTAALDRAFAGLQKAEGIVAAVSGGPDSIAMMHLLARWNAQSGISRQIVVATVNHGFRPEAVDEAVFVAKEAEALGLAHHTLNWTAPKPQTAIQERAREARYQLLVDLARTIGASHLVTGHTQDDQAETILMRLSRGSGLTGLIGMREERDRLGIRHLRPLLDCTKASLIGLCQTESWPFVLDPSNRDERYARIRWRKIAPILAAEGLTAGRLAALARRARQADEALNSKTDEAFARAEPSLEGQTLRLNSAVLATEPFEIALRILMKALSRAGLDLDNSRLERLEACTAKLRDAIGDNRPARMTVAGALMDLDRGGRLTIGPETPRQRGR